MINRRDLLRLTSLAAGMLAGLPQILSAKKYAFSLDKAEMLKKVGGSSLLKVKDTQILFIRDSETTIRALDPTCSHKKCTVAYHEDVNRIICPCHGSTYDVEGKVLKGPAEKPLRAFDASISEDKIIFSMD